MCITFKPGPQRRIDPGLLFNPSNPSSAVVDPAILSVHRDKIDVSSLENKIVYEQQDKTESKLKQLIMTQNWPLVMEYLFACKQAQNIRVEPLLAPTSSRDAPESALHLMCRNDPPLPVVQGVLSMFPHLAYQSNAKSLQSQQPLNVAVTSGASSRVVTFLLQYHSDLSPMFQRRQVSCA